MKRNNEKQLVEYTSKRLNSEMRVYYGLSQEKLLSGFSVDLSTGGLYLNTDSPFAVDENLILRFTLSDQKKTVTCKARVAWVNSNDNPTNTNLPPGAGIQFLDLSLVDLQSIRRFLEHSEIEPAW